MSEYAAIASVTDCVPLQNRARTLARLGMSFSAWHRGSLLPAGLTIRQGRSVFGAARDERAAERAVETLNELNQRLRQLVAAHFGGVCAEISQSAPVALVLDRDACPKGIAGLLAA